MQNEKKRMKWEKGNPPPQCVHFKHGAWYFVVNNKWNRLSPETEAARKSYNSIIEPREGKMAALIDEALRVRAPKAESTRKQYALIAERLKGALVEFDPHQVQPKDIKQIMRDLRDTPNMANRALTVLRIVFTYAVDDLEMFPINPAKQVDRYYEASRKRLLTVDEFWRIHAHANPRLQIIMEICYLTGQRIGDVLSIHRGQIRDGGIEFQQQKTGKRVMVRAPGLMDVVDRAKALSGQVLAMTLFRSRETGKPPTYNAIHKQWRAACKAAKVADANLHDIRAMSLTAADAEGLNATALAGHSTPAQTNRYLRSKVAKEVTGPVLRQGIDAGRKK